MQDRGLSNAVWAFALVLLSGCDAATPADPATSAEHKTVNPRFAKIKNLAQQSCSCKLVGRESKNIDERLKAAAAGLKVSEEAESSAPLVGRYDCYPELGENACTAAFSVGTSASAPRVCNVDQVKRLEKAFLSTDPAPDGTTKAGAIAMEKELSIIRQELAKSIPQSACS